MYLPNHETKTQSFTVLKEEGIGGTFSVQTYI